jgi:hypothetical protein
MKAIMDSLWNYPTAFAGALQAANAVLAAEHVLPPVVAVGVAALVAAVNFAAVTPTKPKR